MKRTFAIVLAMMLALMMSVSVYAAPGSFVSSPSGNAAPTIIDVVPDSPDCTMKIIITPYSERDKLPDDEREQVEKAYSDIAGASDLTELWKELAALAEENNITDPHLAVSDLFQIHGEGCDDHDGHKGFEITLDADTLSHFFALMQMDENGNWSKVDGAYINEDGHLVFHLTKMPVSMAIVVNSENVSPETSAMANLKNDMVIYGALMLVSALAIVVLVIKSKKYA